MKHMSDSPVDSNRTASSSSVTIFIFLPSDHQCLAYQAYKIRCHQTSTSRIILFRRLGSKQQTRLTVPRSVTESLIAKVPITILYFGRKLTATASIQSHRYKKEAKEGKTKTYKRTKEKTARKTKKKCT